MSDDTKIEWADATWNPIRARDRKTGKVGHYCEMISPGCANCYASAMQPRFGLPPYTGPAQRAARLGKLELFLDRKSLEQPVRWKSPRRIFVCSMTDLFGDWVPDEWIDQCFATMALTPQHTHQVLTKRAERMRDYLQGLDCAAGMNRLDVAARKMGHALTFDGLWVGPKWPLRSVWTGVSVEDQQRADERIPLLLQMPSAVRFLSCEPLLGPLDLHQRFEDGSHRNYLDGQFYDVPCKGKNGNPDFTVKTVEPKLPKIHWVICGGESGGNARPCRLEWIRAIVRQCRRAGVAPFVKQLGSAPEDIEVDEPESGVFEFGRRVRLRLADRKGGTPAQWPADLRIREFPEVKP